MANNLTRLNPFGGLSRFDAFRDFQDLLKDFPLSGAMTAQEQAPRLNIDVSENEKGYMVKAEAPGAKKEDIKVTIDGNTVSIRVETKRESEEKEGETVLRSERYYGVQSRTFSLAHEIDDAGASARYSDGVLELTLPKRPSGNGSKVLEIS